jgi:hypothetical protein
MQSGCINHHFIDSYACPPFNTTHAQNRPKQSCYEAEAQPHVQNQSTLDR